MAKNKVSEWSSTPSDNTDIGGIDINEGCAPSGINNAIREAMAQIKDMQAGLDSDNFTVGGNLSVTGTSTLTGNVTASGTLAVTGLTTATGGVAGDIYASNGTSKVLENGTDGTNATFTGAVTGNVTGTSSKATNIVGGNNTTLLGSIPYQSNTDTTTLLSPNTTTTKRYLSQTGTGTNGAAPAWDTINQLTTATVQNLSGTEAPFTSIPSWVRRITVMFNGASLSAAGNILIQLGTGATPTYTTSGYVGEAATTGGTAATNSSGLNIQSAGQSTSTITGNVILTNITGNTWVTSGSTYDIGGSKLCFYSGSIALSGTLTALRVLAGAGSFDAGSVNIMYE